MANPSGKPGKPLRGILFDFDGTLVDSLAPAFESFNFALRTIGESPRTPEQIMAHFGAGEDVILSKLVGDARKAGPAFALYKEHQERNAGQTPLHPGVGPLLDRISAENIPTAIVTGRNSESLAIILNHHALAERFVTCVADDHVGRPKPSPEGILLALSRMGLTPEEAMYVGDSPFDIRAAHSAGVLAVAAVWDVLARLERLRTERPHRWASHPGQVWEIFREPC